MKKYIAVGIFAIAIILLVAGANSINGVFSKAFSKSLSPGEIYERNITVRKFYDLTVRFQKENSTSYLAFDNNETLVVLKDANGNEISRGVGASNGRIPFFLDKIDIDRIYKVSAYNLGTYIDISAQDVNVTYSGTSAYVNVKVYFKPAAIKGYVIDDLTGSVLEGVNVLAFAYGDEPTASEPINSNITDSEGRYFMAFPLNSSRSLEIYVRDYTIS